MDQPRLCDGSEHLPFASSRAANKLRFWQFDRTHTPGNDLCYNEPRQVAEEGASGGGRTELLPGTERSALFLIRSDALDAGLAEDLLRYIERRGFVVPETFRIGRTDEVAATADRGEEGWIAAEDTPTFGEGGLAVFAVDPDPLTPSPEQRKQHPALENSRILGMLFPPDGRTNRGRPERERARYLLAIPDPCLSRAYARSLLGANVAELAAKIDTVTESYRTPQPVLHCFKRGRHTKVGGSSIRAGSPFGKPSVRAGSSSFSNKWSRGSI